MFLSLLRKRIHPQARLHFGFVRTCLVAALAPALASASAAFDTSPSAPLAEPADNVEGGFVNLAAFPIRPMVFIPAGGNAGAQLWAINNHDNTLCMYSSTPDSPGATPNATFPTAWAPVSVGYWWGPDHAYGGSDDEILVVSRGTWVVQRFSRRNGTLLKIHQLRPSDGTTSDPKSMGQMAEPGDILVYSTDDSEATFNDQAFVSCSGADSVVQIDLLATTAPITRVFSARADGAKWKAPLFLSHSYTAGEPDGRVLVAPLISGNNSMWGGLYPASGPMAKGTTVGTRVYDLTVTTGTDAFASGLPDHDLFLITPKGHSTPSNGQVECAAKRTGTMLFGQARNPVTGELWQLNTDARNQLAAEQGEPNVTNDFSVNRISILTPDTTTTPGPSTTTSLDFATDPPVGQPFSVDFDTFGEEPDGRGFVVGLLTDNVAVFDNAGNYVYQWAIEPSVSARKIPRQILLREHEGDRFAYVYCWGDNKIRSYEYTSTSATLQGAHDLGYDPNSDAVQEGRGLFFDASISSSLNNNSCASCHIDAGTDMLAWNLSNLPKKDNAGATLPLDDKGGMVTQTLVGIERLAPFHWRGERMLPEFNEFGFPGLFGHTPLSAENLAKLQAFLFSLNNPANPNQERTRIIDDAVGEALVPPITIGQVVLTADATQGQTDFSDKDSFKFTSRLFQCSDCHMLPLGTSNDIMIEEGGSRVRRGHLKIPPFHELWRKEQATADVFLANGDTTPHARAFLGAGLGHTGEFKDIKAFVGKVVATPIANNERAQDKQNIEAYLAQFDTGLAPAVHFAYLLEGNPPANTTELTSYLKPQANPGSRPRNCDIVVIGTVWNGSALVKRRWAYDPRATPATGGTDPGAFVCEEPGVPALAHRSIADFITALATRNERNLFIGVPVGTAQRIGIDFDSDGLLNLDPLETDARDPAVPTPSDSTSPTFLVQPNVRWATSKAARIGFVTNEPTRAEIRYRTKGSSAAWLLARDDNYSKVHSVILNELLPSTQLDGWQFDSLHAQITEYEVEVEVFNRTTSTASTTSSLLTLQTKPFPFSSSTTDAFDPLGKREDWRIHNEHLIESLTVSLGTPGTSTVPMTVSATVVMKRGATLSGTTSLPVRTPAENRVVVGHLIVYRSGTGFHETLGAVDECPGDTVEATTVYIGDGTTLEALRVLGDAAGGTGGSPFLITRTPSNTSGQVTMTFDIATPASTDVVQFVVDGVFEIDAQKLTAWDSIASAHCPSTSSSVSIPTHIAGLTPTDDGTLSFSGWSFPDSKEKNSVAQPP